jgi:excisionase family DNA binding protein
MKTQAVFHENRPRVYTVGEVSQVLNVSEKTVYRLVARGLLKASKALRHLRIPVESVEAFLTTTTN